MEIYNNLLDEIENSGINQENLWKLWHADSHLIADDKLDWKSKCPTFYKVLDKIKNYFNMDIKATRFNYYRNSADWKPFHHVIFIYFLFILYLFKKKKGCSSHRLF